MFASERMIVEIDAKLIKAQRNKQSILVSAFSGKLVEALQSDGSSLGLLDQIKQQKLALEDGPAKKRIPAIKMEKPMRKRKIIDVLKESKDFMTVDKIFEAAGYGEDPDEIELFYLELKHLVEDEAVDVSTTTDDKTKTGDLFKYVVAS
jgi:hypothetical protein